VLRGEAERGRGAGVVGRVFPGLAGESDGGAGGGGCAGDAGGGGRAGAERTEPAALQPRGLTVFSKSAGDADCGSGDAAGGGERGGAGADGADCGAVFRRRPDAVPATFAGPVQGFAGFAAAAVSPG